MARKRQRSRKKRAIRIVPNQFKRRKVRRYTTVARRKKRSYSKGRRSGGGNNFGGLVQKGIGAGGAVLYESYLEPRILSSLNVTTPDGANLVGLGVGLIAPRYIRNPMVKSAGDTLVTINAYQLLRRRFGNLNGGTGGSVSNNNMEVLI